MNWDAIGAIAELLGAIGVIASLVYLATQIRQSREQLSQNTRAVRANTYQESLLLRDNALLPVAFDSATARLVLRGFAGQEELDAEEALRFNLWMTTVMSNIENTHYQLRVGFLEEERWDVHRHRMRELLTSPGGADWWRTSAFRRGASSEFVALVEEILGEEAEGADGGQ